MKSRNVFKAAIVAAQPAENAATPLRKAPDRSPATPEIARPLLPRQSIGPLRIDDMVNLFRSVRHALPDQHARMIEVIASNHGEGVSTVVRGLAHAAAAVGNARVLICDATPGRGTFGFFRLAANQPSLNDFAMQRADLRDVIVDVPSHGFAVCALADPGAGWHIAVNLEVLSPVLATLRQSFDLILIDAPPTNHSVLGPALARETDGVILVLESERTRAPAAKAALQSIEINSGRMLGVVLNKRRFHIPRFMYRWL